MDQETEVTVMLLSCPGCEGPAFYVDRVLCDHCSFEAKTPEDWNHRAGQAHERRADAGLLAKMTPGTLIAAGWGDGSTLNGMTNIFNEDAEVLLMECIPEHDAAGIVALVNAAPALLALAEQVQQ